MFRGAIAAAFFKVKSKFGKNIASSNVESMLRDGKITLVRSDKVKEGAGFLYLNEKDADKLKLVGGFSERNGLIEKVSEGMVLFSASELALRTVSTLSRGPKSAFKSVWDSVTGSSQRKLETDVGLILHNVKLIKSKVVDKKSDVKAAGGVKVDGDGDGDGVKADENLKNEDEIGDVTAVVETPEPDETPF